MAPNLVMAPNPFPSNRPGLFNQIHFLNGGVCFFCRIAILDPHISSVNPSQSISSTSLCHLVSSIHGMGRDLCAVEVDP